MMLSEQLSFGGRVIVGPQLVGIGALEEKDSPITVRVDFSSDRPVTPEQFATLASAVQKALVPAVESTKLFIPIAVSERESGDDKPKSAFLGIFEISRSWSSVIDTTLVGRSANIQGVTFTVTSVARMQTPNQTLPGSTIAEEKGLSTAAMFGLGVAGGVAVASGVVYVATRKKKRRRRAA